MSEISRKSVIHVISSLCLRHGACVTVCPVDCIVPGPESDERWGKQYYIDPYSCIGCGECVIVCPTSAIFPEDALPKEHQEDADRNVEFFEEGPGYWNNDIESTEE
jgi:ferredoxin--NADP+ reductase